MVHQHCKENPDIPVMPEALEKKTEQQAKATLF
jgi:hypothetical protein